jgi:hypothetical protein
LRLPLPCDNIHGDLGFLLLISPDDCGDDDFLLLFTLSDPYVNLIP